MTRYVVEEVDGEFVIPIAGFVCHGLEDGVMLADRSPAHVDLLLHNDDFTERAMIRIADGAYRGRILSLVERNARVVRGIATSESALILELDEGDSLDVPAGEYEAWEVQGPGPVNVVSPAGGGEPAIWDATSETQTIRPGDPLPPELVEMLAELGLPTPAGAFELRRARGKPHFKLGPPRGREEDE